MVDRLLRERGPLPPLDERVRLQAGAKGRRLLEPSRDLFKHVLVGAAHEDADLEQLRQVLRHRLEAAHEEVPDGDVGAGRAGQHLLEPREQCSVEDVHRVRPLSLGFSRLS